MDPDLNKAVNQIIKRKLEEYLKGKGFTAAPGLDIFGDPTSPTVLEKRDEDTVEILFYVFIGLVGLAALFILINCLGTLCYDCGRGPEYEPDDDFQPPPRQAPEVNELVRPNDPQRRALGVAVKPFSGVRTYEPPSGPNHLIDQPRNSIAAPAGPPPSKPRPTPKPAPKPTPKPKPKKGRSRSRVSKV